MITALVLIGGLLLGGLAGFRLKASAVAVKAGAVIVALAILMLAYAAYRGTTGPHIITDLSHPAVVKEIRQLGRLETSQYTMDKVIDSQVNQPDAIRNLLFGDKLILVAHGTVIAGVDLQSLSDQSVSINGSSLTVTLPDTELLSSSLDASQTKVFDRQVGLFTKGDLNLESQARASAEASLRTAACEAGILQDAKKNAEERIRELYMVAGFTNVTVNVEAGTCS